MSKRVISPALALFVAALWPGMKIDRACAQVRGIVKGVAAVPGGLAPLSLAASIDMSPPPSISPIRYSPALQDLHPAMVLSVGVVLSAAVDFERRAALDASHFDQSKLPPAAGALREQARLEAKPIVDSPEKFFALPQAVRKRPASTRRWDAADRLRDAPDAPQPSAPGASAYAGLGLIALAFLVYPAYPFIATLPLPLASKVAVAVGAYALSWGLFFAGGYLGGRESWRSLKTRLRRAR